MCWPFLSLLSLQRAKLDSQAARAAVRDQGQLAVGNRPLAHGSIAGPPRMLASLTFFSAPLCFVGQAERQDAGSPPAVAAKRRQQEARVRQRRRHRFGEPNEPMNADVSSACPRAWRFNAQVVAMLTELLDAKDKNIGKFLLTLSDPLSSEGTLRTAKVRAFAFASASSPIIAVRCVLTLLAPSLANCLLLFSVARRSCCGRCATRPRATLRRWLRPRPAAASQRARAAPARPRPRRARPPTRLARAWPPWSRSPCSPSKVLWPCHACTCQLLFACLIALVHLLRARGASRSRRGDLCRDPEESHVARQPGRHGPRARARRALPAHALHAGRVQGAHRWASAAAAAAAAATICSAASSLRVRAGWL